MFYLRFTDYAGIGLLEMVMISTLFLAEIPTGAVADLLGRKMTLAVGAFFGFMGNLLMGSAADFSMLLFSVFIYTTGSAFISGTMESLGYDALDAEGKSSHFEQFLAHTTTIRMVTLAVLGGIGGLLYTVSPGLPFYASAAGYLVACCIALLIHEPKTSSQSFSLRNYIVQTKQGFHQLFRTQRLFLQSSIVIGCTMIVSINGHMLIDAQLYERGWSPVILGILASCMFLLSGAIAQLSPRLVRVFGLWPALFLATSAIAISMIVSPFFGAVIATTAILPRDGILQIFGNVAQSIIHRNTASAYRATTISTYNMLASIPYVAAAYFLGTLMEEWSVDRVTQILGFILVLFLATSIFVYIRHIRHMLHPKHDGA